MSEKNQYVGLEALIRIIAHIKAGFATLGHKHPLEDIEDYVVDDILSSTSTNPLQNKVIAEKITEMENTLNTQTSLIEKKADKTVLAQEKTERQAEIAVERARINQFVSLQEGSTTGDAELIDARVDKNGNAHDNVGEHIREVTSQLSEEIVDIKNVNGLEWDEGHYISSNGVYTSATDRACTDFIPCKPFATIEYVGENNHQGVCGISFFDKLYQFISGDINSGNLGDVTTLTSPGGTAYMRISTKMSIIDSSYVKYKGQRNSALTAIAQRANNLTVYVDGIYGDDSNIGNYGNPVKTINRAIQMGAESIGIFPSSVYRETINVKYGKLHLFAVNTGWGDGTTPNRVRAKLDGNSEVSTILTIQDAEKVILEDIEVYGCTYDGCLLNKCQNVELINCAFHDNGHNGIVVNYTNGVFRKCLAYNNEHDGFNLNYYGDTQFYDCCGYDNGDDGISHHQGCTGYIDGGEWYGNEKGGVASPCHGARVDICNIYSHDNGYGIYANSDSPAEPRTFRVWNCVLTNNEYGLSSGRNTAILYGNKIADNTISQTTAPNDGQIITL